MSNYRMVFAVIVLAFSLAACFPKQTGIPQDFSLRLDWNTGSLPPQYHYAYSITVDSQGNGVFHYHPGYEDNAENDWTTEFSLTSEQMSDLYRYLQDNSLLKEEWKIGQPLMGGRGTGICIVAGGIEIAIPSVSELADEDRAVVNNAIEFIDELVDPEIWDEMETRQQTFEANYAE